MNSTLEVIFGLLGGLAVFIFGMNMMSDCLQKAAGEKMKRILALLTKNPILGVLAGALTTAVLQSSSATTVMAIGFVSAGLMNLPQAISIILGANIGTTMTAQIIAFKLSDYICSKIRTCKKHRTNHFCIWPSVPWNRDDGKRHETVGIQPDIYRHDRAGFSYSGSWCSRRNPDDTCRTEQQCHDRSITELCRTAWTGRRQQYPGSCRSNPDSAW